MSEELPVGVHCLLGGQEPIRLDGEERLTLGRSPGNRIVLNDPHASRTHAEIYWDGKAFVVADLNSTHGTRVNGERITTRLLRDGDRLSVGGLHWIYRVFPSEEALDEATGGLAREVRLEATLEGDPEPEPSRDKEIVGDDFNGTLSAMDLPDVCQFLYGGRRHGILLLATPRGRKGKLYFIKGVVRRAESADLEGDRALLEMLEWKEGTFRFQAEIVPVTPNVSLPMETVLHGATGRREERYKGFDPGF